ncbi:MAG: endonuclease/exonuclease/phosphatase family protein [Methylococcales bacterium]|nr:endonuclease/exonuclease/phosphatase family protein [Methylococcales bacterium]
MKMDKIKLLYVENIITRKTSLVQQQLTFFILVENVSYSKQVDVIWAGEDDIWHTLPVNFHGMQGLDKEHWHATINFDLTPKQSLAGNIKFSLRYRVSGKEYWDNNHGLNYAAEADSGIQLTHNQQIQNVGFDNHLEDKPQSIALTIAVANAFNAKTVTIHWTTNRWETTHKTKCCLNHNYWDTNFQSNARNPNQYETQLWTAELKGEDWFKSEYIIKCENSAQTLWENNAEHNYRFQHERLKILILNLHCYQEENQDDKFTQIAKTIDKLEIDIVCLQEVAEYWRDGEGDWESNSAKIINDRLNKPFYLHNDWSHLGFDKYREGVAILSRYPLSNKESSYVSESHDIYSIHSRKVVAAEVYVPFIGKINVFSAHLSWLEDGFKAQFEQLQQWADKNNRDEIKATLLCGDFNVAAGSSGYQLIVDSGDYEDQFLAINKQGVFEKVFKVNDDHWRELLADDYRIDYIFMKKGSELQITSAKVIFTDQDYGPVSDHCGYFMTFEPR